MAEAKTKYRLHSMNAFIDGLIISDFDSEAEAIEYAANYEARLYRLEPDGRAVAVYWPGMYDTEEQAEAGQ